MPCGSYTTLRMAWTPSGHPDRLSPEAREKLSTKPGQVQRRLPRPFMGHYLNERSAMRIALTLVYAMWVASTAVAQQAQPNTPSAPNSQSTVPLPGIDDAAMASSARASKLIGAAVYKGNTSIGKIDDVVVDLDRGAVSAVVLSVGGFLGMGDKLVAVPSNQIKVSAEAKFTTDLTKDQLTNAPAFDPAKMTR
jgi:sporulation protein YlmC with PRC-barrel domain